MPTLMADYLKGRLLRIVVIATLIYAVLAIVTDAPPLIRFGNGLVLPIFIGVLVAYAPVLIDALLHQRPSNGAYAQVGLWIVAAAVVVTRIDSIVARDFGWPEIYNTDWATLYIFLFVVGGLLLLVAPNASGGRVPPARWVTAGVVVAIGFFFAFGLWGWHSATHPQPSVQLR